jgi:hypothetical protein
MRPATILSAVLGASMPLLPGPAAPGTGTAQPVVAEGHDDAAAWRCERAAQWLTRCGMEVAAPGGAWEITARVWLRRPLASVPLAGDLRISVGGRICGFPAGVSLPAAAQGGLVNHTLLARCSVILAPGLHLVEALAGFGTPPATGADRVEVLIARRAP